MPRLAAPASALVIALVVIGARAQPDSTGSLPPVEPAPTAQPPASAAPPPTTTAAAQPLPPAGATPPTAQAATQPAPVYGQPAHGPAYGQPAYGGPGYSHYPGPDAAAKPAPPPTRSVSITISPIHLLIGPIVEGALEVRPVDHLGIAVVGGYGTISAEDSTGERERFDAWELGGQLAWYPQEAFHGLSFGAEFLYAHVSSDNLEDSNVRGIGTGYAIGPFVGYKLLTEGGFTFVAQGGIQYLVIDAEASDTAGNTETESESRFIPLLNLNLGWSF